MRREAGPTRSRNVERNQRELPHPTTQNRQLSILGVKKLFEPSTSRLRKCLWLLILLSCLTACLYQSGERISAFLTHSVTLEVKLIPQTKVKFPSITMCSLAIQDFFSTSEYEAMNVTRTVDPFELWGRTAIELDDLNVTTQIQTSEGKNSLKTSFVNLVSGRCIEITLTKKMDYQGPFTLVDITWHNKHKEKRYVFSIFNGTQNPLHYSVVISELALVGYESTFRIYAKEVHNLNLKQNPCVSESDALNCYNDCVNQKFAKNMTCSLPFIQINGTQPPCDTLDKIKTTYYQVRKTYFDLSSHLRACNCKRKCTEIKYKLLKDSERKSNVTDLILLYADDTRTIVYEREIYSVTGLFSEIGGTVGLYLGISIFTVLQIVEFNVRHLLSNQKN